MRAIYTALLIGLVLLVAQAAQASTLLAGYTDLDSWQAAVTQTGLETFETGVTVGDSTKYSNSGGYLDPLGIDFVGAFDPSGYSMEVVNASLGSYYNFGSGNSLMSGMTYSNSPYIMMTLPPNITAIALNLMTTGNQWPVTLTASDGTTYTIGTSTGQQSFYGFTFSAPITSLKVSIPGAPNWTYTLLDNVRIGTACTQLDPVPEPRTLLLIGLGLVLLASLRRYRRPDTM